MLTYRNIFLLALSCTLTLPAIAAPTVQFSVAPNEVQIGDTVTVTAKVQLGDGEHVYPSSTTVGYPTQITLENENLDSVGELTNSKGKIKTDPDLGDHEILTGEVTFQQQFKVLKSTQSINGKLDFQICTAFNCQLHSSPFSLKVATKAVAKAETAKMSVSQTLEKTEADLFKLTVKPFKTTTAVGETIDLQFSLKLLKSELYTYPHDGSDGFATSFWLSDDSQKAFAIESIASPTKVYSKEDEFSGTIRYHKGGADWTVRLKALTAGQKTLDLSFNTQACTSKTCVPIEYSFKQPIQIDKGMAVSPAPNAATNPEVLKLLKALKSAQDKQNRALQDIRKALPKANKGKAFDQVVPYHHSYDKGVEAALKSGKLAFVVFTGHYCTNCRQMEQTVLVDPKITKILEDFECIVLHVDNTKDPEELKNREIYARLKGPGPIPWYAVVNLAKDQKTGALVEKVLRKHTGIASAKDFAEFLTDGQVKQDVSWLGFILACIGFGLLTLFMPCTYPMIPITLSLFSKGGSLSRGQAFYRSSLYAAGIVFSYTAIGGVVQLIFGGSGQQQISDFANNGVVNLIIGSLFIYFAFSFFGYYEIAMPSFMRKLMQFGQPSQDESGAVPGWSLFLMGIFFMLTSYSCGAPFVLAVFEQAASKSHSLAVVLALFVFSSTIAIPFMFLSLVPSALKSMPKSGGWFTTFKVTLGFFELAFALKFLSTTDIYFNIGFLTRPVFIGIWIVVLFLLGLYLLGVFMFPHDMKHERMPMGRFICAVLVFVIAVYLGSWFAGQKLWSPLEALMPPHPYPTLDKF